MYVWSVCLVSRAVIAGFDDIVGFYVAQNILLTPTTRDEIAILVPAPTLPSTPSPTNTPHVRSNSTSASATSSVPRDSELKRRPVVPSVSFLIHDKTFISFSLSLIFDLFFGSFCHL